jgi:hypothetical protein
VYSSRTPRRNVRRVFLDYVKAVNELYVQPTYYNTVTTDCTTSIEFHTRMKVLLSGYVPDYLYELGRIDTSRPFAELEKLAHVNARAHAAVNDPVFSQRIREGLPMPALWS